MTFEEFWTCIPLNHFHSGEILRRPDPWMWGNIIPTILILDELRSRINSPIVISSSYRDPKYNAVVGGAPLSQHQAFTALDFSAAYTDPVLIGSILRSWWGRIWPLPDIAVNYPRRVVRVPAGNVPWWDIVSDGHFTFRGGVGVYQRFIHLDTRGHNQSWRGNY